MSLFNFWSNRKESGTATAAKERLQLIIAHESNGKTPDFLPKLRDELIAVISRYTSVTEESVNLKLERRGNTDFLEMNLVLGEPLANAPVAAAKVEAPSAAALAARVVAQDRAVAPTTVAAPATPEKVRVESSHPARRGKKHGRR